MRHSNSIHAESTSPAIEKPVQSGLFRYGAIVPLAAVMTIGLALTMAGLVATEFTPQDKTETAVFEINPVVEDILDPVRTVEIDPLREVEVPPPPPTVATIQTAAVDLPFVEVVGEVKLIKIEPLDLSGLSHTLRVDSEPVPHVRIPPVFPNRFMQGDVSGYCRVQFDISPDGRPFNVSTTRCTNAQLKTPTVKSVQKWKYAPKIQNGRPVSRSGLETTIRFDLQDENGDILPLPNGY